METTKNHYEELIDQMMIDEVSGLDMNIKATLEGLTDKQKRMAILSILDNDRDLYMKLRKVVDTNTVSKSQHIKIVVKMLRRYVEVGDVEKKKFGEVMTPISLVEDMLDKLPKDVWSNPELKWLDPANGVGVFPSILIERLMDGLCEWEKDDEKRYKHIMENMIHVAELQPKNMFLYLCGFDPYDEYALNIYTGSFLDEAFDNHAKEVWGIEKFDIIVGNPPYNQMIDMKFVEKSYNISDKVLYVHPSTWLLDEKNKQKRFINVKNLIKNHLESIELFNGNGVFGISLFVPCVITYINKNKTTDGIQCYDRINNKKLVYDDIFDVNKFNNHLYLVIKDKIIFDKSIDDYKIFNISTKRNNTQGKLKKYKHLNTTNEYYINIAQIRGNVKNVKKYDIGMDSDMLVDDFYTILTKANQISREIDNHMFWKFENLNNSINFLNYLKTNFARFCLAIYKNNSQLECGEMGHIPWLDFSQEWTDEKLIKEFNLTEEEVAFIEKVIPNYY